MQRLFRYLWLTSLVKWRWFWFLLGGEQRPAFDYLARLTRESSLPKTLFVSMYAWGPFRHRPHHLAARLAKEQVVLYVRPLFVRELTAGEVPSPIELEEVEPKLFVLHVTLFSGEDRIPPISWLNRWLLGYVLSLIIGEGGRGWSFISNDPKRWWMLERFPEMSPRTYDVLDNYAGFSWASQVFAEAERQMVRRVDGISAGTHELYEWLKNQGKPTWFLPCGVDVAHFAQAKDESLASHPAVAQLPSPTLFYMGMVDERIDQQLIQKLSEAFPHGSIVLAGPVVGDFSKLAPLSNVHLIGRQDYSDLPSLLRRSDVALIPFVLNDVTKNINPTKLLEYLASGTPVVSVAIPDVQRFYADSVFIAADYAQFIEHTKAALTDEGSKRVVNAETVMKQRSWEHFTEVFQRKVTESVSASVKNS